MVKVLELVQLSKSYNEGKENSVEVFSDLNLEVNAGEVVGLIAPSGYGKSTILHIAGLLDMPSGGDVIVAGEKLTDASDNLRTKKRRNDIGFVFQFHHLLAEFSATENVTLPLRNAAWSAKRANDRAQLLLEEVGLSHRLDHRPQTLSGGEQQRVAICRALSHQPKLLLADEPTGNLDPENANNVFELFVKLAREEGMGALVATHNLELADKMDRLIDMRAL